MAAGRKNKTMKILALDLGGSFLKYAAYEEGTLAGAGSVPTRADRGPEAVLATMAELAGQFPGIEAAGISFASPCDPTAGTVTQATDTFPGFTGLPLAELLGRRLGVPVTIDNDVNCAALGEGAFGAAKDCPDFLCLTYGTGIGGAIVLDGKLHYGGPFSAGEAGHMTLRAGGIRCPNCGRSGCYEAYASTTALVRRVYDATHETLDGQAICRRYEAGDAGIAEVVEAWVTDVCIGLASCIHLIDPPVVVLGGGIMENATIFGRVNACLRHELLPNYRMVDVRAAKLGNAAGLYGAAIQAETRAKALAAGRN